MKKVLIPDDNSKPLLTLALEQGWGDFAWTWVKAYNLKDQYRLKILIPVAEFQKVTTRSSTFLDILTGLSEYEFIFDPALAEELTRIIPNPPTMENMLSQNKEYGYAKFVASHYLRGKNGKGNRIETFLPELPCVFNFPIEIYGSELRETFEFIEKVKRNCDIMFLIYCGPYGGICSWNLWQPQKWIEFITEIENRIGKEKRITWVQVGTTWDTYVSEVLEPQLKNKVSYYNMVEKTTTQQIFTLLKSADIFVSYNCGLAVMSTYFGTKTIKMYPDFCGGLMNSWPPQEMIDSGKYKAFLIPSEKDVVEETLKMIKL